MATLRDGDFDSMADYLLERANKIRRVEAPIDLFSLASLQRVTAVDFRPMIPTGGLSCRASGFVIYLQDLGRLEPVEVAVGVPSEDRPKLSTRQRFTFAHELAHTLLFSMSDPPQLRTDAPHGSKLEALCHRAARRLLMPPRLIVAEIAKKGQLGSGDVVDIARLFEVSAEVALWRCGEIDAVRNSNRALLLVRRNGAGLEEIVAFYCSDWIQDRKGRPELGMSPATWLSGFVDEQFWSDPGAQTVFSDQKGRLQIKRVAFHKDSYFIDLEREVPQTDQRMPNPAIEIKSEPLAE